MSRSWNTEEWLLPHPHPQDQSFELVDMISLFLRRSILAWSVKEVNRQKILKGEIPYSEIDSSSRIIHCLVFRNPKILMMCIVHESRSRLIRFFYCNRSLSILSLEWWRFMKRLFCIPFDCKRCFPTVVIPFKQQTSVNVNMQTFERLFCKECVMAVDSMSQLDY